MTSLSVHHIKSIEFETKVVPLSNGIFTISMYLETTEGTVELNLFTSDPLCLIQLVRNT